MPIRRALSFSILKWKKRVFDSFFKSEKRLFRKWEQDI